MLQCRVGLTGNDDVNISECQDIGANLDRRVREVERCLPSNFLLDLFPLLWEGNGGTQNSHNRDTLLLRLTRRDSSTLTPT